MDRDELKRYIKGPIATLPTAFNSQLQVDLGVMADLTQSLVAQGITADRAPLKVAAAMSEGPVLTDEEWPRVLQTVVEAAGPNAKVMCGLKARDTRTVIEDAQRAQDLGAIGLQIEIPYLFHPTQDDMVRFFSDISDAINIGIMIYNTWWWGIPGTDTSISIESLLQLADAEHVVAIKWSAPPGRDYDDMRQFSHIFNVIDNEGTPGRCYKNGGRGFLDFTAALYPAHTLQVADLLDAGQYDQAQVLYDGIELSLRSFTAGLQSRSGGYRVLKALWPILGHAVGSPRLPTLPLDKQETAQLRELVKSWGWPVTG